MDIVQELTQVRRHLHGIPELAYQEHKTQAFIMDYLHQLDLDRVEPIGTGVYACLMADHARETIALRADMDALAITEETDREYASQHEGRMHACGHDGHMAALLLCAKILSMHKDQLKANVVFLFQPAEEDTDGASGMIRQGVLESPRVNWIYGMHIWPEIPAGMIGIRSGILMAQCHDFDISVKGKAAHGATPQRGCDANVAAAALLMAMQALMAREVAPEDAAVLTAGQINGGEMPNIISGHAVLRATLRTVNQDTGGRLLGRLEQICQGIAQAYGAQVELYHNGVFPPVDNHPAATERLRQAVECSRIMEAKPVMLSEDFSWYQQQCPGSYFFLGSKSDLYSYPLHDPRFDFDEAILYQAVKSYCVLAGVILDDVMEVH